MGEKFHGLIGLVIMLENFCDFASIIISTARCCLFRRHMSGFKYEMVEVEVEEYSVLGFHVYEDTWRPWLVIGEELRCQREEDNTRGSQVKLMS